MKTQSNAGFRPFDDLLMLPGYDGVMLFELWVAQHQRLAGCDHDKESNFFMVKGTGLEMHGVNAVGDKARAYGTSIDCANFYWLSHPANRELETRHCILIDEIPSCPRVN